MKPTAQLAATRAADAQLGKREAQLAAFYASHRCVCGGPLDMCGDLFTCRECRRYGCRFLGDGGKIRAVLEFWGQA